MSEKELVLIPRATLDVYKYNDNGLVIYEFNATECSPPEPMVNTIVVLDKIRDNNERLVVTYFHEPTPLFQIINSKFSYDSIELDSGNFQVTYKIK